MTITLATATVTTHCRLAKVTEESRTSRRNLVYPQWIITLRMFKIYLDIDAAEAASLIPMAIAEIDTAP